MKKNIFLVLAAICFAATAFGQVKVDDLGFANFGAAGNSPFRIYQTENIGHLDRGNAHLGLHLMNNSSTKITGYVGGGSPAVFSVKYIYHPKYDLRLLDPNLILISTYASANVCAFTNYIGSKRTISIFGNGQIHTAAGLIQSSDSLCKENIDSLSSTLPKIGSLRGISFNYKELIDDSQPQANSFSENTELQYTDSCGISFEVWQQMQSEKSRKRIGLVAQEVEKIVPEVVRTLPDGSKGIMYTDLVALLIEGIKELQAEKDTEVAELKQRLTVLETLLIPTKQSRVEGEPEHESAARMGTEAFLSQNNPNPFNRETEISYRLPENTVSSCICIYSLNGLQLKKYPLSSAQEGKVTISASAFRPGMYIYALIADNQEITSKRMILTE